MGGEWSEKKRKKNFNFWVVIKSGIKKKPQQQLGKTKR